MTRMFFWRILASLILLLSIVFMPFWLSVALGIIGMMFFPVFWEAVFWFLISDFLYGTRETRYFGITFVSFIFSILLLITIESVKKRMR